MIKGEYGNLLNEENLQATKTSKEIKLINRENDRIEIVGGVNSAERQYCSLKIELSYNHGLNFYDYEVLNFNNNGKLRYDINTHATHIKTELIIAGTPLGYAGVNPVLSVYWK